MANIGRLAVQVTAETSGLSTGLNQASRNVDQFQNKARSLGGTMDELGAASSFLAGKIGALAGAFGATQFVNKLVDVQRQFDVLNASMITVTGSAAAAEREFAWLKDFAATTPFALDQVVGAFVRMSSLGLNPSRAALESFGNTASAMGKNLNQMIEAVADASTGEFERLKEFGIRARQQGETVSLTFQGVTTTIRNSSEEITRYLTEIGNNQFAGAMAERARTLDGAISNLADTWDELFRTINNANAGGMIASTVSVANGAMQNAIKIIDAMSSAANNNAQQTGAMSAIINGMTTVFETVAVVGANVIYVLKATGRELGGLAAQATALARFDFSGAKTIGQLMREDAIAARQEVDRLSAAILNARNAAIPTASGGGNLPANRPTESPRLGGTPAVPAAAAGESQQQSQEDKRIEQLALLAEREREYWAGRMQRIAEGMMGETELLEHKHQQDLARLDAAIMSEDERRIIRETLESEHLTRLAAIEDEWHIQRVQAEAEKNAEIERQRIASLTNLERFTQMSYRQQAMHVASAMKEQLTSVNTNSRAMFNIQKAANISQAVMDTYAGATRALKDYPAPWSYGVAAATVAAGMARVASIKSQSFGGASAAGGGSAGGGVAATNGMAQGAAAPGMNQTVTIQGMSSGDLFSGDAVRTLIDRLIDAQRNGARIVLA
jgi:hypothetical protein